MKGMTTEKALRHSIRMRDHSEDLKRGFGDLRIPARAMRAMQCRSEEFGVPLATLRNSSDRRRFVVEARRSAIADLVAMGYSHTQTGKFMGGMHSSSVCATLRVRAVQKTAYDAGEIPCPDYSGEWAI